MTHSGTRTRTTNTTHTAVLSRIFLKRLTSPRLGSTAQACVPTETLNTVRNPVRFWHCYVAFFLVFVFGCFFSHALFVCLFSYAVQRDARCFLVESCRCKTEIFLRVSFMNEFDVSVRASYSPFFSSFLCAGRQIEDENENVFVGI